MGISSEGVSNCLGNMWKKMWRRQTIQKDILDTKLNRCMTTFDLIFLSLGHMMGSGIYVITGTVVLLNAGPSSVISYPLAGIVALLLALCYAQFSVNIPKTGSCYAYVYTIAGELPAFLAGWNLLLEYLVSIASVGRSLSAYLDTLAGGAIQNATSGLIGTDSEILRRLDLLSPLFIIVVYIIIAIGAKSTANANNILVFLNIVVILTITISGFVLGNTENITKGPGGFFPFGFTGTVAATGLLFYSYLGFDAIATASEETKDPSKSLPIAFCVSIAIGAVLYTLATLALTLLVPYNEVDSAAPFPLAFEKNGIVWAEYVVGIGATIGLSCSLLGQAYCLPRGMYALASDGLLFSKLTYVNQWTKTPLIAILISAIVSALIAMLFPVEELVEMVSIGALFAMVLMIICLLQVHYIPAEKCPFELKTYTINDRITTEEGENKPILNLDDHQNLQCIGKLRYQFPILKSLDGSKVIKVTIAVSVMSFITLAIILVLGGEKLLQGKWWAITIVVLVTPISLMAFCVLLLYEHNTSFAKFKVPLFPWIPTLALFLSFILMMGLSIITWIRLVVWIAIGLIFYFIYGIHHSTVGKKEDYQEMDSVQ